MLRIAIQSKGRLNEDCIRLLEDAGITIGGGQRKLLAHAKGFPMDILYLRDDDIPQAVAMGVADIGIVGLNELLEKQQKVDKVMDLAFSKCRLSLAVPRAAEYEDLQWFQGRKIATSYPVILDRFLKENNIDAEIHEIAGSVEIAPSIGMADAIFDIVSSGGTLMQNNLREVYSVLDSNAVLIANENLDYDKRKELDQLLFRFESITKSRDMKYVLFNLPEDRLQDAIALMPGMKSPTVLPLAIPGWISVHSVVKGSEVWEKVEGLKNIGAEGILVIAIENMIL